MSAPLYPRPNHSADESTNDRCHKGKKQARQDVLEFVHVAVRAMGQLARDRADQKAQHRPDESPEGDSNGAFHSGPPPCQST
jgi:hypothetical protein